MFYGDVFAFVGDVVDEAHEGVEGDDAVAAGFREEEECVIEIAVRGFGDLEAGLVGSGDREGGGSRDSGDEGVSGLLLFGLEARNVFCATPVRNAIAIQFGGCVREQQATSRPACFALPILGRCCSVL